MSKQFLMMIDENSIERFKLMFRGDIHFLEVQGMNIGDNNNYKILVAPVAPPVPPLAMNSPVEATQAPHESQAA